MYNGTSFGQETGLDRTIAARDGGVPPIFARRRLDVIS
jgi:hypothetical protein